MTYAGSSPFDRIAAGAGGFTSRAHDDVDLRGDVEELKEAVGLPQVS